MQDFIDFIKTDNMKIIERSRSHVVIKQFDTCLEYSPCSGTGQFSMAAGDIDIYDYDDYIEQNIKDLNNFKCDYLTRQVHKVASIIRKAAPYSGLSSLCANKLN